MNADALAERVAAIQQRIAAAAARADRLASDVTLIAVSKTHPIDLINAVLQCGISDFGENRVQEAETKITTQTPDARQQTRWHLIGHLQSNKARRAIQLFDLIHTVSSAKLAVALNRIVQETTDGAVRLPILLQVNVSGEASKEGFGITGGVDNAHWNDFVATVRHIAVLPHLHLQGLMTIPPFDVDLEQVVRPCFRMVRVMRDALETTLEQPLPQLSMGMSGDFEIAVEEGATLVRVGTAIFGHR